MVTSIKINMESFFFLFRTFSGLLRFKSIIKNILPLINVSEVSDWFEFFSKRFAQSRVPTIICCVPDRVRRALLINRARRTLSGTQHFIVSTCDWANRFEKNSNQSLTSLTWNFLNLLNLIKQKRIKWKNNFGWASILLIQYPSNKCQDLPALWLIYWFNLFLDKIINRSLFCLFK